MVTKKDLVKRVSIAAGVSQRDAQEMIEIVFGTVEEAIIEDGCVRVAGFGTFKRKLHNGRDGYNPATGKRIEIKPYHTVSYKIANDLKARLN